MFSMPKRALAITPHADDVTLFAGGLLLKWISEGCEITVLRVTQDEKDSFEYGVAEAIEINLAEFEKAMKSLGVSNTIHLNYRDCELLDVPHGELREHLIRAIRKHRPEIVVSFDPHDNTDENPDHAFVARAVADASWAAGFPNFHPEHAKQGLETWTPMGNYYFTRYFNQGDVAVDITDVLDRKIEAVLCHRNMLRSMIIDQKRRIQAAGIQMPALDALTPDDYAEYWQGLIRAAAAIGAEGIEFTAAERFRSTVMTMESPIVQYLKSLEG